MCFIFYVLSIGLKCVIRSSDLSFRSFLKGFVNCVFIVLLNVYSFLPTLKWGGGGGGLSPTLLAISHFRNVFQLMDVSSVKA